MGFEFVYAYLDNLSWLGWIGSIILGIILFVLVVLRIENEIDIDDWTRLMCVVIPMFLLFLTVVISPSMDHIRKVRTAVQVKYEELPPKPEEKPSEVPKSTYYPSDRCASSLVCKYDDTKKLSSQ